MKKDENAKSVKPKKQVVTVEHLAQILDILKSHNDMFAQHTDLFEKQGTDMIQVKQNLIFLNNLAQNNLK